jgi:FtsH-binding integral membrane protein
MDTKFWIGIGLTALAFVLWLLCLAKLRKEGYKKGAMIFFHLAAAVMIVSAYVLTMHRNELPMFSVFNASWLDFLVICGLPVYIMTRKRTIAA